MAEDAFEVAVLKARIAEDAAERVAELARDAGAGLVEWSEVATAAFDCAGRAQIAHDRKRQAEAMQCAG